MQELEVVAPFCSQPLCGEAEWMALVHGFTYEAAVCVLDMGVVFCERNAAKTLNCVRDAGDQKKFTIDLLNLGGKFDVDAAADRTSITWTPLEVVSATRVFCCLFLALVLFDLSLQPGYTSMRQWHLFPPSTIIVRTITLPNSPYHPLEIELEYVVPRRSAPRVIQQQQDEGN